MLLVRFTSALLILILIGSSVHGYAYENTCKDLLVLFARGSGQNGGDIYYGDKNKYANSNTYLIENQTIKFFDEVDKRLPNVTKEFLSFHDIPGKYNNYGYAAVDVVGGFSSKPKHKMFEANQYYESVDDGSEELAGYLQGKITKCPDQKIILGGYSQGAQVVGNTLFSLSSTERSHINYVALYGDPKFLSKDNTALFKSGPWKRGNTTSLHSGVLGSRKPYVPEDMRSKVGSWCDKSDPICSALHFDLKISGAINFSSFLNDKFFDKTHSNAYQDKWIPQSMNEIVSKIDSKIVSNKKLYSENTLFYKNGTKPLTDIVLVIDTSEFMSANLEKIRANKKQIAEKYLKNKPGTQVGIVKYTNQNIPLFGSTPTYAMTIFEPTSNLSTLEANLGNIYPSSSGSSNTPLYNGLHAAVQLEKRTGRFGAQKHFIGITNNIPGPYDYVYPNKNIKNSDVIRQMYLLDPAVGNAIVLPSKNDPNSYPALGGLRNLANLTNGQTEQATTENLVDVMGEVAALLDTSPVAAISEPHYVGSEVYLSAGDSYDPNSYIIKYRWDCNDDGVYELEDIQPSVVCKYDSAYNGLVGLEIEAFDGQTAKMYTRVTVSDEVNNVASLAKPLVSQTEQKIVIENNYDSSVLFSAYDENGNLVFITAEKEISRAELPEFGKFTIIAKSEFSESEPSVFEIQKEVTLKSDEDKNTAPATEVKQTLPDKQEIKYASHSNLSDNSSLIVSVLGFVPNYSSNQSFSYIVDEPLSSEPITTSTKNNSSVFRPKEQVKVLGSNQKNTASNPIVKLAFYALGFMAICVLLAVLLKKQTKARS